MTPLQIVALGVRFFALVWFLYVLNSLPQTFIYLDHETYREANPALVWIAAAVQLGLCAVIWFFPRTIAAKLLPSRDAQSPAPNVALVEWQTLGVILIGLWALTDVVRSGIYWISLYSFTQGAFEFFSPEYKASMIVTIAELPIALWLLLGAKGLAAILFKIRAVGQRYDG